MTHLTSGFALWKLQFFERWWWLNLLWILGFPVLAWGLCSLWPTIGPVIAAILIVPSTVGLLGGDSETFRSFGMNSRRAFRQQAYLVIPVVLLTALALVLLSPGLGGALGATTAAIAGVLVVRSADPRTEKKLYDEALATFGTRGSLEFRLMWRGALIAAILVGVSNAIIIPLCHYWGLGQWQGIVATFPVFVLWIYLSVNVAGGTGSLRTFQSLGLRRRVWVRQAVATAVVANLLPLLVVVALWLMFAPADFDVFSAALGMGLVSAVGVGLGVCAIGMGERGYFFTFLLVILVWGGVRDIFASGHIHGSAQLLVIAAVVAGGMVLGTIATSLLLLGKTNPTRTARSSFFGV
ncbi:hypothetical protein QP027_10855 [Corynebacterium breve]|uniref:ABC transporter permease n=1 Tax=Corynebacterium breve TaxID=3049799 RepID=A0ABY8VDJ2_9CORY|nr:hypothetical protein [Corynebacterium breve]WIM67573.1 hypothetical protein QP027_10855 [Corynebacterium breve]